MNLLNADITTGAKMLDKASRIALMGNGGNLAVAQHAASDINRHTGKFCFAPDAVHLTALGGDNLWKPAWMQYASQHCDMILAIGARADSPMIRDIEEYAFAIPTLVIAPKKVNSPYIETIVCPSKTYHEFEVNALWTVYMLMENIGVKLPELPE